MCRFGYPEAAQYFAKAVNWNLSCTAPNLPLPMGEVPSVCALGAERGIKAPLSQKSQIFASSPKGRAKAAFGGRLPDKL